MEIKQSELKQVEMVHHLEIVYNGYAYFFIVITTKLIDDISFINSINRGCTYWDCQKKLKNSEKKRINKMIEEHFKTSELWIS